MKGCKLSRPECALCFSSMQLTLQYFGWAIQYLQGIQKWCCVIFTKCLLRKDKLSSLLDPHFKHITSVS